MPLSFGYDELKNTSRKKLGYLQTNNGEHLINMAPKEFCNEKSIIINYIALYIHKENRIVK